MGLSDKIPKYQLWLAIKLPECNAFDFSPHSLHWCIYVVCRYSKACSLVVIDVAIYIMVLVCVHKATSVISF